MSIITMPSLGTYSLFGQFGRLKIHIWGSPVTSASGEILSVCNLMVKVKCNGEGGKEVRLKLRAWWDKEEVGG